jgi:hypothetical protein
MVSRMGTLEERPVHSVVRQNPLIESGKGDGQFGHIDLDEAVDIGLVFLGPYLSTIVKPLQSILALHDQNVRPAPE